MLILHVERLAKCGAYLGAHAHPIYLQVIYSASSQTMSAF
jgi:hypothetical protein